MMKKIILPLCAAAMLLAGCDRGDSNTEANEKQNANQQAEAQADSGEKGESPSLAELALKKGAEWLARDKKEEEVKEESSSSEATSEETKEAVKEPAQSENDEPPALAATSQEASPPAGPPAGGEGIAGDAAANSPAAGFTIPGADWHWSIWALLGLLAIIAVIVLTHSDVSPRPWSAGGVVFLFVAWFCYCNDFFSGEAKWLNLGIFAVVLVVYLWIGGPRSVSAFKSLQRNWDKHWQELSKATFIKQEDLVDAGGAPLTKIPEAMAEEFKNNFWPQYAKRYGLSVEKPNIDTNMKLLVTRRLFWVFHDVDYVCRRLFRDLVERAVEQLKSHCDKDTKKLEAEFNALFHAST